MKMLRVLPLSLLCMSGAAFATTTQVYVEQNLASNAADAGTYTTEAGALIDTSENGQVYIGFDDQGWLAAGYGHSFSLAEDWGLTLYGELGKWETGEEILVDAIVDYQVNDSLNLFGGLGYNRSGQVIENLSDTAINTNKFMAGASTSWDRFKFDYTYTHENRDGTNAGFEHSGSVGDIFSQDSYRTNEHEFVVSTQVDDWTPYIKYTHFNTQEGDLSRANGTVVNDDRIKEDNIWTLGVAYQF